jgi:hypothetical protein
MNKDKAIRISTKRNQARPVDLARSLLCPLIAHPQYRLVWIAPAQCHNQHKRRCDNCILFARKKLMKPRARKSAAQTRINTLSSKCEQASRLDPWHRVKSGKALPQGRKALVRSTHIVPIMFYIPLELKSVLPSSMINDS